MSDCVYFIETEDHRFVKIGYSRDIKMRLSALKVSSPQNLLLLGWIYGDRATESLIHKQFIHLRRNGEWFSNTQEVKEFISSLELCTEEIPDRSEPLPKVSVQVQTIAGRTSDLADLKMRSDWSELNAKLKVIEPGEVETVMCPLGISLSHLRSTILTNGRRFHKGDWRFTTRTEYRKIHCFLCLRNP